VLEALAVGLPVIGSSVDGIKYLLQDEFVLFSPGDSDELLQAVGRVASHRGYARAKRVVEKRRSRFDFYWEEKYLSILESVSTPAPPLQD
jgi:glycosyltransferase involved in cell wall biosynthesis